MEERTPQPGDTVLIQYRARYTGQRYGFQRIVVSDADGDECEITAPMDATVEVLEPADDPSKNEIGIVRREDYDAGHSAWQCVAASDPGTTEWLCTYSTDPNTVGEVVDHSSVIDVPVIGAAPGTPAAAAELAAVEHTDSFDVSGAERAASYERATQRMRNERQVPMELRQKLADALVAGDKVRAVRIACNWGMDRDDAVAYLAAMPEHQTYLNFWHAETAKEPAESRKLIVHPHVWKSLTAWLVDKKVRVVERVGHYEGDKLRVFVMDPMDGEWGTDE